MPSLNLLASFQSENIDLRKDLERLFDEQRNIIAELAHSREESKFRLERIDELEQLLRSSQLRIPELEREILQVNSGEFQINVFFTTF